MLRLRNKNRVLQVLQLDKEIIKAKMKIFIALLINLLFVTSGFICAKNSGDKRDNDRLPDSRPEKIVFRFSLSGGMMYYSEDLYISSDSCYYSVNDGGAVSKIHFNMLPAELDKLYKVFTDNDFDRIETYEEKIYDRGGESIYLSWGSGKYASVSNSGMSLIEKSWRNEWSECINALGKIVEIELSRQKKDYEVRIDKSLFGKEMYLQLNRETVIPKSTVRGESEMEAYITKTVKLMPGMQTMSVNIGNKYENVKIDTDSSRGVNIYLKNDSLFAYEYIK
jgi:hypothetical protein